MSTFFTPDMMQQAHEIMIMNKRLEGVVPGEGTFSPVFTVVSEAPGRVEAETGHPFMGPAGKTLDDWLTKLGLTRKNVYLTAAVRSRPFTEKAGRKSDRKPTKQEEHDFAPLLDYELSHLPEDHDLLIGLGNTGLQRLLGNTVKIGDVHGELLHAPIQVWNGTEYEWSKRTYPIVALYHPSYVRRFPKMAAVAEADLVKLKQIIQG